MMWTTLTDRIRKAFSDAADQYDILTSLHKEIGRELVKKNVRCQAARILDIGCGTGYVANKAKFFFPESLIVGLDIAEGMLKQAALAHEGIAIEWLQADAGSLPFKDKSFDLLLSNLSYQWVEDLPKAFVHAHRVMSPGAVFNATLFGTRTCEELFATLKHFAPDLNVRSLPGVQEAQKALEEAGFKNIEVDYELIKVEFRDVRELLGWLKAIGSNNLSPKNMFLGKEMLSKAQTFYRMHYPYKDGIRASFEVVWAYAKA